MSGPRRHPFGNPQLFFITHKVLPPPRSISVCFFLFLSAVLEPRLLFLLMFAASPGLTALTSTTLSLFYYLIVISTSFFIFLNLYVFYIYILRILLVWSFPPSHLQERFLWASDLQTREVVASFGKSSSHRLWRLQDSLTFLSIFHRRSIFLSQIKASHIFHSMK